MASSYLSFSQYPDIGPAGTVPRPPVGVIGSRAATYSLDFLTTPDSLSAYGGTPLAAAVARRAVFSGPISSTNPEPEAGSGYSGDQYNHFLTFGVPTSEWGQLRDVSLFLTNAAITASPTNWFEIDNIPNVSVTLGDHPAAATPGSVPLNVANVENLRLDAASPFGALVEVSTATPRDKGGLLQIASGPAGGDFAVDQTPLVPPGQTMPPGFVTDGSTQALVFSGGAGNDSLLIGGFAGYALIDMGANTGTYTVIRGDFSIGGITADIPHGPPSDASQLSNIWSGSNFSLGDFSIVAKYAVGTSAEQDTVVNSGNNGTGRVGVLASPLDAGVGTLPLFLSGLGISAPGTTPTVNTGAETDFGLNAGYMVGGQTGHDELDLNWSPNEQVASATVTLESNSLEAIQNARLGIELFSHGKEVYSSVLSPDPASIAQQPGSPTPNGSNTDSGSINLVDLVTGAGTPITWDSMRFIAEPSAPGATVPNSFLISSVSLHDVPQLYVSGGDNVNLGTGKAIINYNVGQDGVQVLNDFAFGNDALVLQNTSLSNVHVTQYGTHLALTFGNDSAGLIELGGMDTANATQHLHAAGHNVVFS